MFGKLDIRAEVVNGVCPTCTHPTLLVSITPDHFRCITCGTDLRQHINGKISYIDSDLAKATTKGLVNAKEIELLKVQIEEIKVSTSNPLTN